MSRTIWWSKKQSFGDIIMYGHSPYKVISCCRYQANKYYLTISEVQG